MHTPRSSRQSPRHPAGRRRRRLASRASWLCAALVGLAATPGCQVPGACLHNLDELHESTGRHERQGDLVSPLGYYLRFGSRELFGEGSGLLSGEEESFDDPLRSCLRNAAALARMEPRDERVATAQLATLAWLAVECPWNLTRETCMRALGPRGARLDVEVPPPRQGPPAGPEELRPALARTIDAVRAPGAVLGDSPSPELEQACAALEALDLDRAAALRLVRGLGALVTSMSPSDPRALRLARTLRFAERSLVAETLLEGLADAPPREVGGSHAGWSNPRVRAAAAEACIEAFGDDALGELVQQLDQEREAPVVRAILVAVSERGLPPAPSGLAPEAAERVREGWIQRILLHAFDHPSGSVRVAAMHALERVSGGAVSSLREGDWLDWHLARQSAPQALPASARPESRASRP